MKTIRSVDRVIEVLGGPAAVSRLPCMSRAEVSSGAVFNWKVQQKLPARTYVALGKRLEELGFCAPMSLWGMIEP